MRTIRPLALLVALVLPVLSACSTFAVHSDHDTTMSFEGWSTWAWADADDGKESTIYHARIRRSTTAALTARGYREVAAGKADFLVHTAVEVEKRTDVTVWGTPYHDYRWGSAWRPTYATVQEYRFGTLILDLIARKSGTIAWRGWAEAQLLERATAAERDARIDEAVGLILDRFPPE